MGAKGATKASSTSSTSVTSPATTPPSADTSTAPPTLPITPVTPAQVDRPVKAGDGDADQDGDIDMDMSNGSFVWPGPMDAFSDFWASWWPEDASHPQLVNGMPAMTPSSTFSLDPALEAQGLASLEFPPPFLTSPDGALVGTAKTTSSTSNGPSSGSGQLQPRQDGIGPQKPPGEIASSTTASPGTCSRLVFTADKEGSDLSIAQLSRLSTRLSQLLGSSRRFLAEALDPPDQSRRHDPVLQVQRGIEAVFKSINAWLVHGSPSCGTSATSTAGPLSLDPLPTDGFDLLHHVFSASNHLLEILRHIRVSVVATTPGAETPAFPSPPASSLGVETVPSTAGTATPTTSSGGLSDGSHPSCSVVHHLVLVCVTLLLNMYLAILIALQRSADAVNLSLRERERQRAAGTASLALGDDHMDTASRVHLQLVSVVQLCSYFIRRQNHILDASCQRQGALSLREAAMLGPSSASASPPSSSRGSEPPRLQPAVPSDAVGELMAEVEQRLRRLQESLYMPTP